MSETRYAVRSWLPIVIVVFAALLSACGGTPPPAEQAPTAAATPPTPQQAPTPQEPATPTSESARSEPVVSPEPVPEPEKPKPAAPKRRVPAPEEPAPVAASVPEPTPPPPPAPAPEPIVKTLPAGTTLDVVFVDGLSSQTSQVGESFKARVARDVTHDGLVVIPAGSTVVGTVTEAVPLKKIGGTAKLSLSFSTLELTTGSAVPIEAVMSQAGKSETKKDAATIGGSAAGGALLGRIIGKDTKGALIGAVVGAAAGTAVAAKTKGEQVEVPAGTEVSLSLSRPVEIAVKR